MLPVGPEYCVVWFDWGGGVFRRTTPGKIHEMTEEEELDLGARSILQSERLTYYEEGEGGKEWCVRCAMHAAASLKQAGSAWIPVPGLRTPREDDSPEPNPMRLMRIVPPRPHAGSALQRQRRVGKKTAEEGRALPDETFKAIMEELERRLPGITESLNEGR